MNNEFTMNELPARIGYDCRPDADLRRQGNATRIARAVVTA